MTTRRRPTATCRTALAAAALAAALCLPVSMGGCIEDDPVAVTIEKVSNQFEALGAPGTAIPGDEFVTDVYEDALRSLRSVAGQGSETQQASIQLLMARAEFGLAKIPLRDLNEAHAQASRLVSAASAQAAKHVRLDALASASAVFDPSDEIAELQTKIGERSTAIETQRAELERVTEAIAELDGLAAEADARADEIRLRESELRTQARAMEAPEAMPFFEQAAELRNQADALAADAERRRAQADVLRPEVTQIEGEIDRLTEQRVLLEDSIESLRAEAEESTQATAALRSEADEVMRVLTARVDELESVVSGAMAEAYDASIDAYDKASAEARKAARGLRSQARLFEAESALAAAGLAASQAEQLAQVVRAAAAANQDELVQRAQTLAAEASELAMTQLDAAREAYSSAGVRGEAADRIDAVLAQLEAMLGIPPDGEAFDGDSPVDESPADLDTVDDATDAGDAGDGGDAGEGDEVEGP